MTVRKLYSVSISGRAILDLHSLNNEGTEGNQLNTRQVYIVIGKSRNPIPAHVNAISGDMLKHIQTEHYRHLAQHYNLPLSQGARLGNANRINWDFDNITERKLSSAEKDFQLIDRIITTCSLTDVAGTLVTGGNKSTPRKSLVEFGWVVGLPEVTKTESYLHTKYVADSGQEKKGNDGSNLGQNLFHRPASSGVYAFVCHIEVARVGYNDIAQHYPTDLSEEERSLRSHALLESVLYTFLQMDGAHRNTQTPHVVDVEGVIATSNGIVPAPAFSALHDEYVMHIERIAAGLNTLHPDAITLYPFDSLGAFTETMTTLIAESQPYRMPEFGSDH
jgi:CRISPR-associated protein Cst2